MSVDSALVKRLNRLFSGPLAGRKHPKAQRIKQYFYNSYKFQQTSWNKTLDNFQKNEYRIFSYLNLEALNDRNRRARYREFDLMEFMPELSSALDIYSDEMCSFTDLSPILNIECQDTNQKQVLTTLFYDVLDVRNNLWSWVRKTCKYGDFFLYLHLSQELGVQYHVDLPAEEMLRIEGLDETNPNYVRFKWEARGLTFENFQVAHFRIAANERNFPYGVSVLENARRIFRQLELLENAVIAYRIVRAPERRVYYVDLQNTAPKDSEVYLEKIKTSLRRNQVVDPDTGDVTLRYNQWPVHKLTPVKLFDGRVLTIEELAKEFEEGKRNWVYSVQDETHKLVPGQVAWCGKNYTAKKIVEVTLDDGGVVKTAPEHPFVMRDGSSKRADELELGDALMPFAMRRKKIRKNGDFYDYVYDPGTQTYVWSHKIVAEELLSEEKKSALETLEESGSKFLIIHHKNFDKYNNNPENLQWMGNVAHSSYHGELGRNSLIRYNKSEKHRADTIERNKRLGLGKKLAANYNGTDLHKSHNEIRAAACRREWATKREEKMAKARWTIPDVCFEIGKQIYRENPNFSRESFIVAFREHPEISKIIAENNASTKRKISRISRMVMERRLLELGYSGFREYKQDALANFVGYSNHKVLSVRIVDETVDVYCMTVVGPNGERDRHNFGVSDFNNPERPLVFVKNSIEDDLVIPVRGQNSGTRVETLAGGQYQGGVEDVQYLRNKLFAAIKIPSSYLEDKDSPDTQGSLTQKDVRFARTICRLQSFIVAELEKIAQIHLSLLGFTGEKLVNFKLSLNNPSKVWDIQEMEFLSRKIEVANSAKDWMDQDSIYRQIFNFSTDEIRKHLAGRVTDAKFRRKVAVIETPPEAGGLGGGLGGGLDMGGGMGDLGGIEGMGELGGGELGGAAGPEAPAGGGEESALLSAPARRQEPRRDTNRSATHYYDHGSYQPELNPDNEVVAGAEGDGRNSVDEFVPETPSALPSKGSGTYLGLGSERNKTQTPLSRAIPGLDDMKSRLEETQNSVIREMSRYQEKKNG